MQQARLINPGSHVQADAKQRPISLSRQSLYIRELQQGGDRLLSLPQDYDDLLNRLKERIRTAQVRAALAVNQELIHLYWQIGRSILEQQQSEGWGTRVIERLAKDLRKEFLEIKGFSRSNLGYMKAFAEAYPDEAIYQRCVGKLPWRHNIALLDKVKTQEQRLWLKKAIEHVDRSGDSSAT